jgi:hypothetical protein
VPYSEGLLQQADRTGVFEVDAEFVGQWFDRRQEGVQDLPQGNPGSVESPYPVGQSYQQNAADEAVDSQEPQDERVPQGLATQHDRRGVGGS